MEDKHKKHDMGMSDLPEKFRSKEAFLEELRKSEDPEQMSWMMVNFLAEKVKKSMSENMPEDDQRYGHTWDSRYAGGGRSMPMRSGARYSDNSMRYGHGGTEYAHTGIGMPSRRSYDRSGERMEQYKEHLADMMGQSLTEDDIKCLIVKEAASMIKRICKDEPFEAMKEFTELCIGMKAYAGTMPEDLEEQAKEEAIGKYVEMFSRYGGEHHYRMRSRLMQDDDGYPMRRVRLDDMERSRHRLPMVEVDEFNFRNRARDSMGRFK